MFSFIFVFSWFYDSLPFSRQVELTAGGLPIGGQTGLGPSSVMPGGQTGIGPGGTLPGGETGLGPGGANSFRKIRLLYSRMHEGTEGGLCEDPDPEGSFAEEALPCIFLGTQVCY